MSNTIEYIGAPPTITEDLSAHRWQSLFNDAQGPINQIQEINDRLSSDDEKVRELIVSAEHPIVDSTGEVHHVTTPNYLAWLGIQAQMHGISYAGEMPDPVKPKQFSEQLLNYPA